MVCLLSVQREVEGGAAADGAFGPGVPAVAFDDPLDADQADSCARKLGDRMKSLERLEQLVYKGGIETGSVITDIAADFRVLRRDAGELDGGLIALRGELPGVFDQVLHHGTDENPICGCPDIGADAEPNLAARLAGVQLNREGGDLRAEIDQSQAHLRARYLG